MPGAFKRQQQGQSQPQQQAPPPQPSQRQPQPLQHLYRRNTPKCGGAGAIHANKRIFHKMPNLSVLAVAGGRKCRYIAHAPRGSLTSQPMTASRCGGGRPKAVLRSTPRICRQRWDHTPGHPLQDGRKSQRAAPVAWCHRQHAQVNRDATARPIHRHPTSAGTPQRCRSSRYERR